jgi:hypothetical protein
MESALPSNPANSDQTSCTWAKQYSATGRRRNRVMFHPEYVKKSILEFLQGIKNVSRPAKARSAGI